MHLPKTLIAAAVAALALPAAAQAAPPWSAPVSVSSEATSAPHVLFAGGAGTVAFNGPGASFARPVLQAPLDGSAQAVDWPGAKGFDTTYGAFAGGERALYVGSNGEERVLVGEASGPNGQWRTSLRGPKTGGARAAAAPGAAVFGTFGPGSVYLVRQEGAKLEPTQKLSGRGSIRSVAVATNAGGDILAVWDRAGTIEARYWYARSERLSAVKALGKTDAALKLGVALGDDRRAVVGWIDQRISEGEAAKGSAWATARTATRGFAAPKQLDTYGNNDIAGGVGVKAAPNMVVFSGSDAIKAALVNGRSIGAPQAIAPVAPDQSFADIGLGDLATSAGGKAVVAVAAKDRIWAVPFDGTAFGAPEDVSGPEQEPHQPSVAFDGATAYLAWQSTPTRVEVSQRPTP
ncbi:hypothetical protein OJ997_23850 [Solirubrobacter phytolaccae]|uniref:Uncharacterized protein n=1 Tax=Solirubrobacter phytolaccae TaxID=1404360 RepID=A0A9X3SD79_9ACTN|nr:hypothetical protein [Solirubrobacter phytolaccae]MDA0183365.1 hypothetical protein [Solirubrobacter phytolaccae]